MALMLGGIVGSLLHPRLAEVAGNGAGLLAAAAGLLLIALVSLRLSPTPGDRISGQVRVPASG